MQKESCKTLKFGGGRGSAGIQVEQKQEIHDTQRIPQGNGGSWRSRQITSLRDSNNLYPQMTRNNKAVQVLRTLDYRCIFVQNIKLLPRLDRVTVLY